MTRHVLPAVALTVLVLAGCGSTAPSTVGAPSTATPAPATAAEAQLTAAEQAFVARISAEVDPVFAEYPERYARRGGNSCTSVNQPDAVDQAVQRFSGGTITVSPAQAKKIVAAARDTVCADS